MQAKDWYGARTVYQVNGNTLSDHQNNLYEERVVVLRANSFNNAIAEAEKEALSYADEDSGIIYLGYVNVFKLFTEKIGNKTEVYSLMRESSLSKSDYLNSFFDTGFERINR